MIHLWPQQSLYGCGPFIARPFVVPFVNGPGPFMALVHLWSGYVYGPGPFMDPVYLWIWSMDLVYCPGHLWS